MTDYIGEANAHPLSPELFIELAQLAMETLSGKRRYLPPDAERIIKKGPPGTITLTLTDIPMNQMGMGIVAECHRRFPSTEAENIAKSFLWRWFAIEDATRKGKLDEFTKTEGKQVMVSSAIFVAASDTNLNTEGRFEADFFDKIRKMIADDTDD
jgi:hypothetical protein